MNYRHFIAASLMLAAVTAGAETLFVKANGVTYAFPVDQTGEMTYLNGTSLNILGNSFSLTEIQSMWVDDTAIAPNTIKITYNGNQTDVVADGQLKSHIDAGISNAHVSIVQHSDFTEEITYALSGTSTDGSFLTSGSYKSTIELHGITLTNPSGAAISIQNGKRNNLSVKDGTMNALADGSSGAQKGCLTCKGHLEIKGHGALTVSGNTAHAIHASEYITLKNADITVTAAVKDGLNCNQYFTMESGSLKISGVGDEGIQVSYKDEVNPQADDTAALTILGGTVDVNISGKGIKADGNVTISGGDISVYTSASGSEGIESKKELHINGGNISVNAYDDGINSGSHMYISDGTITAISRNNDGLDANGNLYIQGGEIVACGGRAPECGIDANEEGGYSVVFTGGKLLAIGGGNSTPSSSTSTQPYVSGNLSVSAGNTVELKNGSTILASFTIPQGYSSSSSNGGFGGGRPGGNNSGGLLITCPGLTSGQSYTISSGSSSTTATATLKGSSGGRPW